MTLRFNNLTVARFVAALLVFLHHSTADEYRAIESTPVRMIMSNGSIGVSFFFLVSGFVLAASNLERLQTFSVKGSLSFYWKRIARIVPLWLVVSSPFIWWSSVNDDTHLLPFLTFTQAWNHDLHTAFGLLGVAWTLSVEMFFYATFPVIAAALRFFQGRLTGPVLIAMGLAVPFSGFAYFHFHPALLGLPNDAPNSAHFWLYRFPPMRFGEFMAGIGIYLTISRNIVRTGKAVSFSLMGVSIAALIACMATISENAHWWVFPNVVFLAAIVLMLARVETLGSVVKARTPILLGEASFAFYLVHQYYFKGLLTPTIVGQAGVWGAEVFIFIMTVSTSIGLFLIVETPCRDMLLKLLHIRSTQPKAEVSEPVPESVVPASAGSIVG